MSIEGTELGPVRAVVLQDQCSAVIVPVGAVSCADNTPRKHGVYRGLGGKEYVDTDMNRAASACDMIGTSKGFTAVDQTCFTIAPKTTSFCAKASAMNASSCASLGWVRLALSCRLSGVRSKT